MENWERGIAAPNSDVEDEEPQDEILEEERPARQEQDYLVTWETSSVMADFEADRVVAYHAPSNRALEEHEIVKSQRWVSQGMRWRSDVIAVRDRKDHKERLQRMRATPEPKLFPLAEVFRPSEIVCEDEELLQIKKKAAAENALKEQRQADLIINQIRDSCARALVRRKEADSYVHPEIKYAEFLRTQKESKPSPTKSIAMASTAAMTVMVEDAKELNESSVADATHMVHDLILQEEIRTANAKRSHQTTTDLADLQLETQPADVFQRMWTLVDEDNPIWRKYRVLVCKHTTGFGKARRQASACGACMTIFYPQFPDDFHLHRKSQGFKTAIDGRVTDSNREAVVEAEGDENELREGTAYKALIALAKEAKAYKKEADADGVLREYIKMVRFVKGVRMAAGGAKYMHVEICERCEVEGDIQEAAKQKYKVKGLADGIIQLILR